MPMMLNEIVVIFHIERLPNQGYKYIFLLIEGHVPIPMINVLQDFMHLESEQQEIHLLKLSKI